jgi:hypothetical protein
MSMKRDAVYDLMNDGQACGNVLLTPFHPTPIGQGGLFVQRKYPVQSVQRWRDML